MLNNKLIKQYQKKGFVKFDIKEKNKIIKVKNSIIKLLKDELKNKKIRFKKKVKNDDLLNQFHNLKLNNTELNSIRLNLINKINKKEILIEKLFKIFSEELKKILGSDIVGQRKVNLVIQKPNDDNVAPIHRDCPPNSPNEIVFWLPLVDCYKSKSINVLDLKYTKHVEKLFSKEDINYKKIINFIKKNSNSINCEFGNVLIFSTNNFHYIPINKEEETRFSLNFRFKNLFKRYGSKFYLEYFKIVNIKNKSNYPILQHVKN